MLAGENPFVRPIVDWAHVHAMTGGRSHFQVSVRLRPQVHRGDLPGVDGRAPADPVHRQSVQSGGEVRHIPYGTGRSESARWSRRRSRPGAMVVISEAREESTHDAIQAELNATISTPLKGRAQPAASSIRGKVDLFPIGCGQDGRTARAFTRCRFATAQPHPQPRQAVLPGGLHEGRPHPVLRLGSPP